MKVDVQVYRCQHCGAEVKSFKDLTDVPCHVCSCWEDHVFGRYRLVGVDKLQVSEDFDASQLPPGHAPRKPFGVFAQERPKLKTQAWHQITGRTKEYRERLRRAAS